jgi:DNA-binding transcriptional MerR regulator
MRTGQKLSRAAARKAHRAYLADPLQTLDTLAPPLGITASALHRAWRRLGLSCCPAADRGGNVRAQEQAKARRAEREAAAEAFKAKRAAAGCTPYGLRVDVARSAWARFVAGGVTAGELAAEVGCTVDTLRRNWRRMGLDPRAARIAATRREHEPVTRRLFVLTSAEGLSVEDAAAAVGLKATTARERLKVYRAHLTEKPLPKRTRNRKPKVTL